MRINNGFSHDAWHRDREGVTGTDAQARRFASVLSLLICGVPLAACQPVCSEQQEGTGGQAASGTHRFTCDRALVRARQVVHGREFPRAVSGCGPDRADM